MSISLPCNLDAFHNEVELGTENVFAFNTIPVPAAYVSELIRSVLAKLVIVVPPRPSNSIFPPPFDSWIPFPDGDIDNI